MVTKEKVINAIKKNFNISDDLEKYGSLTKHSNVCWHYRKNKSSQLRYIVDMFMWSKLYEKKETTLANIPGKNSIMNFNCRDIVLCENFNTGKNLLIRKGVNKERFDLGLVEIDTTTINGKEYYIIWD